MFNLLLLETSRIAAVSSVSIGIARTFCEFICQLRGHMLAASMELSDIRLDMQGRCQLRGHMLAASLGLSDIRLGMQVRCQLRGHMLAASLGLSDIRLDMQGRCQLRGHMLAASLGLGENGNDRVGTYCYVLQLAPTQLLRAVIGDPPRSPLFLERCSRGYLIPFWKSRGCRQRRDLLASQTSSRLLEFPIRLATKQECSGETGWRPGHPRRNTRVRKDSGAIDFFSHDVDNAIDFFGWVTYSSASIDDFRHDVDNAIDFFRHGADSTIDFFGWVTYSSASIDDFRHDVDNAIYFCYSGICIVRGQGNMDKLWPPGRRHYMMAPGSGVPSSQTLGVNADNLTNIVPSACLGHKHITQCVRTTANAERQARAALSSTVAALPTCDGATPTVVWELRHMLAQAYQRSLAHPDRESIDVIHGGPYHRTLGLFDSSSMLYYAADWLLGTNGQRSDEGTKHHHRYHVNTSIYDHAIPGENLLRIVADTGWAAKACQASSRDTQVRQAEFGELGKQEVAGRRKPAAKREYISMCRGYAELSRLLPRLHDKVGLPANNKVCGYYYLVPLRVCASLGNSLESSAHPRHMLIYSRLAAGFLLPATSCLPSSPNSACLTWVSLELAWHAFAAQPVSATIQYSERGVPPEMMCSIRVPPGSRCRTGIVDMPGTTFGEQTMMNGVDQALSRYDPSRHLYIQVDTSEKGLGVVIFQLSEDNEQRIVDFGSAMFGPVEQWYNVNECGCLAEVWSLKKFRALLEYKCITLQTDNRCLLWLHIMKEGRSKLTCCALLMQP
ncbi:hypothetical protein PR048_022519 [Dryococelus australis]|uniref:Reverse transcriptase RNase H-like domain-containing protein n=1 Tax=Dryococelus australis TaxID=614101 RepID=A0ABQ9H175_9NEOP|nr:hypothetical protein PR048_022519 [Dryococelus australis]